MRIALCSLPCLAYRIIEQPAKEPDSSFGPADTQPPNEKWARGTRTDFRKWRFNRNLRRYQKILGHASGHTADQNNPRPVRLSFLGGYHPCATCRGPGTTTPAFRPIIMVHAGLSRSVKEKKARTTNLFHLKWADIMFPLRAHGG